jgi:D-glycero-D-manno-heptose 1,7-bisphosphate phosphatase
MAPEPAVPLLVLDLDGTVRQGKDDALGRFVNGPEDVVVFPEAVEMMRRWKAAGGRIMALSNQGGVSLGIVSYEKVAAAMVETQRQCEGLFDKIVFCIHHPDASSPEFSRCWCRKPRIGGLCDGSLDIAHKFHEMYPPYMALFVGDRPEDQECAANANFDFEWAANWRARGIDPLKSPEEGS